MTTAAASADENVVWRAAFSALCASLIGIGLARFAYTPLIPALIAEHWFSPAQAAYLGAATSPAISSARFSLDGSAYRARCFGYVR